MRLQKYIAMCGVASRRGAERLIESGRVLVNGSLVDYMGCEVDGERDEVSVDGVVISPEKRLVYIALNKPKNYVTTVSDDLGRPTVMELVSDINERIYPVGRLDFDTSGLLIMTNDGDFANAVTHPSHQVDKTYIARVSRPLEKSDIEALRAGVELDGRKTAPARVEPLSNPKRIFELKISIHEGRNRQVRRMLEAVGAETPALQRVAVGGVTLGNLPEGKWRRLKQVEIDKLRGRKNHDKSNDNKR